MKPASSIIIAGSLILAGAWFFSRPKSVDRTNEDHPGFSVRSGAEEVKIPDHGGNSIVVSAVAKPTAPSAPLESPSLPAESVLPSARDISVASRFVTRRIAQVPVHSAPSSLPNGGSAPAPSSFKRAPLTARSTDLVSVPHPAVWVKLENSKYLTPAQQQEIQKAAEDLRDKIATSGLDPASPEYREFWIREVEQSDHTFRQRYGGRAWLQHHVQAYHLAHPTGP